MGVDQSVHAPASSFCLYYTLFLPPYESIYLCTRSPAYYGMNPRLQLTPTTTRIPRRPHQPHLFPISLHTDFFSKRPHRCCVYNSLSLIINQGTGIDALSLMAIGDAPNSRQPTHAMFSPPRCRCHLSSTPTQARDSRQRATRVLFSGAEGVTDVHVVNNMYIVRVVRRRSMPGIHRGR